MFTDFIIEYVKTGSHIALELAFPRNSEIAAVAGFAGWLTSQGIETEGGNPIQKTFINSCSPFLGEFPCRVLSWCFVPQTRGFFAKYGSLTVALGTSFTLNMIALLILGPKKGNKHSWPESLNFYSNYIQKGISLASKESVTKELVKSNQAPGVASVQPVPIPPIIATISPPTASAPPPPEIQVLAPQPVINQEMLKVIKTSIKLEENNVEEQMDDDLFMQDRGICNFC